MRTNIYPPLAGTKRFKITIIAYRGAAEVAEKIYKMSFGNDLSKNDANSEVVMNSLKRCVRLSLIISIVYLVWSQIFGWVVYHYASIEAMMWEKVGAFIILAFFPVVVSFFIKIYFGYIHRENIWPWVKWESMSEKAKKYFFVMVLSLFLMLTAFVDLIIGCVVAHRIQNAETIPDSAIEVVSKSNAYVADPRRAAQKMRFRRLI